MTGPGYRSDLVRRRKRKTLKLFLASLSGKWPYRCDSCGHEFLLDDRAPRCTRSLADRDG